MAATRLLVSVRDSDEAAEALAGGADIIDVKEPASGALGMAEPAVIADVIATVDGRRPTSAALGDLTDAAPGDSTNASPGDSTNLLPVTLAAGLSYVKIGLAAAPADWARRLADAFAACTPARAIAVAYADCHRVGAPPVGDVFDWAQGHRAAGVLIDTAVKDGRGLFDWLSADDLASIIGRARAAGLIIVLAGALDGRALARAAALRPDIVAVRGAACRGGRRAQRVDRSRVGQLAGVIAACSTACPASAG